MTADPEKTKWQMHRAHHFISGNKAALGLSDNFDRPLTQIETAQAVAMGTIAARHAMEID